MEIDRVAQPLEAWFGFIRQNFMALFRKLLVVNAMFAAAWAAALIILVAGFWGAVQLGFGAAGWGVAAACTLLAIAFVLLANLIRLAAYRMVEEEYGAKGKVSITGVVVEKAVPAAAYGILSVLAALAIAAPFIVLGIVLAIAGLPAVFMPLVQVGLFIASLLLGFLLWFGLWELAVAGKGPVESMRASLSLIRRNALETAIFFILAGAAAWVLHLAFNIVVIVAAIPVVLVAGVGSIALAATGWASAFVIAVAAIAALLLIVASVAYLAADQMLTLSMAYPYWRTIRGDIKLQKKPAAATQAGGPAGAGTRTPDSGSRPAAAGSLISGPGFTAKAEERERLPMVVAPGPITAVPAAAAPKPAEGRLQSAPKEEPKAAEPAAAPQPRAQAMKAQAKPAAPVQKTGGRKRAARKAPPPAKGKAQKRKK